MKKVLIVEDDAVLGDVLLQKLQGAGFESKLCQDGAEGWRQIGEWSPDLVVLDLFLPLLNGFDILEQKTKDPRITGIPVVVLTNSLHPASETQIERLGAVDFMVKSDVTTEAILERIKKTLNASSTSATASSQNSLSGKKILLVEDDSFLASILMSRLGHKKVLASYAKSGEEALLELKRQIPDAVLLDILLPGINGFEVLQSIRNNPETKSLPVIVISNFSQAQDIEKVKALGAGYLVKALADPDQILGEVEKLLK